MKDYLWEVIIGRLTIRDMRVYGTAEYITSKYIDLLDVISEEEWQYEKKKFRITAILDTIRPIGLGTCILLSSYLVYTGQITVPVFAAIFTILPNIQEYTETLMNNISKTYTNIPFLQNYFDFIDQDEAEEGQEDFIDDIYKIEFRNVSFKYPSSKKYVIKNMNLILNKNESISVLGENGSGKSTFVKLLLGFYRPEAGQIFINEIDLEKIKKRDYWKKVSSVFQDFTKYNLTIRENVGLSQVDSIDDVNLINHDEFDNKFVYTAKFRYRQADTEVTIKHVGDELLITFLEDVRAVTPGQACVIYQDDRCLGGGFIKEVYKDNKKRKY